MNDQLKAIYDCYCNISGFNPRYAIHERAIAEFVTAGFVEDDLRCVLLFLKRENRRGNCTYSLRIDKLLDFEFRHFDALLSEARCKERNRPKVATPAQAVLANFRSTHTTTESAPAKSVSQLLKELP